MKTTSKEKRNFIVHCPSPSGLQAVNFAEAVKNTMTQFLGHSLYSIENTAQPDKFSNVLTSFWWAIATLTTVGYGDIYPVTHVGKLVAGFISLMGVGLVAIPTGLISAGFIEKLENQKREENICPHCGKNVSNE